jgi:hypothetical protein
LPLRQFQKKIKEEDKNSKSHSVVVSKKYKNQSQNRSQTTANQYAERGKFFLRFGSHTTPPPTTSTADKCRERELATELILNWFGCGAAFVR